MVKFTYVIQDKEGIHARPAGIIVAEAKKHESETIMIYANGKDGDLKRLLRVMALGAKAGTEVTVTVEGPNEEAAASDLEAVFKANI